MRVKQIDRLAELHGVDLSEASNRAQKIEELKAANVEPIDPFDIHDQAASEATQPLQDVDGSEMEIETSGTRQAAGTANDPIVVNVAEADASVCCPACRKTIKLSQKGNTANLWNNVSGVHPRISFKINGVMQFEDNKEVMKEAIRRTLKAAESKLDTFVNEVCFKSPRGGVLHEQLSLYPAPGALLSAPACDFTAEAPSISPATDKTFSYMSLLVEAAMVVSENRIIKM
ncbi:hypothetical protein HDU96_001222 [Phlyctochytrium bullatum]|nr:hypothetical protein HDU96_001222 [Phlyctochytrium bullatum]